ncbi:hypothetical protein ACFYW8_37870 [Streptomyces sp. NPDC002742]|uniref:hypothetical protein n=1 Tax=Streptomyces sp. NPDC002742 TaxID=3364663 RepID=UPI0036A9FFA4
MIGVEHHHEPVAFRIRHQGIHGVVEFHQRAAFGDQRLNLFGDRSDKDGDDRQHGGRFRFADAVRTMTRDAAPEPDHFLWVYGIKVNLHAAVSLSSVQPAENGLLNQSGRPLRMNGLQQSSTVLCVTAIPGSLKRPWYSTWRVT